MFSTSPGGLWSTIAVMGIVLVGILLGVIVIPVVQGRSAGIDAYTAICRALGILPGSPARHSFLTGRPPTPVSQVVWTSDVLQILARADAGEGKAKVQEVCVACHGENGVSASRISASCGTIRSCDLQAIERLPDREPHPSADD